MFNINIILFQEEGDKERDTDILHFHSTLTGIFYPLQTPSPSKRGKIGFEGKGWVHMQID